MDKPQFFVTPGYGNRQLEKFYYSQAVKIGNRIEISGQGGWNDNWEFPQLLEDEIKQAFDNVGRTLKTAAASWNNVIEVISYHVDYQPEISELMASLFRQYMPKQAPLWTLLGVAKLGDPKMRVEIRVTAIVD